MRCNVLPGRYTREHPAEQVDVTFRGEATMIRVGGKDEFGRAAVALATSLATIGYLYLLVIVIGRE